MAIKRDEFTSEEIEFNDLLKSTTKSISDIELQKARLLSDHGPTLSPSGGPCGRTFGSKELQNRMLDFQKQHVEKTTLDGFDTIVKKSQKEPTPIMMDKMERWKKDTTTYPMTLSEEHLSEKNISKSQDFMLKHKDKIGIDLRKD